MKHTTLFSNINGNVVENAGAASIEGNVIFPITSESPKPNIPLT